MSYLPLPQTSHLWESIWKVYFLLEGIPCQMVCQWEGGQIQASWRNRFQHDSFYLSSEHLRRWLHHGLLVAIRQVLHVKCPWHVHSCKPHIPRLLWVKIKPPAGFNLHFHLAGFHSPMCSPTYQGHNSRTYAVTHTATKSGPSAQRAAVDGEKGPYLRMFLRNGFVKAADVGW